MRNILIAAGGSVGDTVPYISIGWELRRRGHNVTLLANPHFESHAAGAGLSFHPAGTEADYQEVVSDPGLCHWRTARQSSLKHLSRRVELFYDLIEEIHEPGRTLLVAGPNVLGARIVQERYDTPLVTALISPRFISGRRDPSHPDRPLPGWAAQLARTRPGLTLLHRLRGFRSRLQRRRRPAPAQAAPVHPLMQTLQRIRSELGLPEIGSFDQWQRSPQRVICMWPSWFADRQADWPRQAVVTGFPLYPPPESGGAAAPAPAREQDPVRPVVFSCISVASDQRQYFSAAVEACRILKCPGLLVTPQRDQVPRELPPEVTHAEYVPYDELLPRSALIVHHGGIGTTARAFAAGIPQVVRPLVADQFDNGNRVQRLGAGRMLTTEQVDPAQLARAIGSLLGSSRVLKRCEHWQSRIDPQQDLARTAEWIEKLAE